MGGGYMTKNALWIVDLLQMQIASLRIELENKRVHPKKFDKFSYGAWAITETLLAIGDYSGCVDADIIRDILKMQHEDYTNYYNTNPERHIKYKYALEMIEYLFFLTEGYEE